MVEKNTLIFEGVTAAQFAVLAAKAQAAGIAFEGNRGRAMKFGAEVAWDYQPETGQLTLQCLQAPFFLSPQAVLAQIDAMVRESMG
jgi:hypothetical protein